MRTADCIGVGENVDGIHFYFLSDKTRSSIVLILRFRFFSVVPVRERKTKAASLGTCDAL